MSKQRLDTLLVMQGLAETRQKAQALILAGQVYIAGQRVEKSGQRVDDGAAIEIKSEVLPYVGRGGLKLEGALAAFGVSVVGAVCLDIGASTGGFTDCLLQQGAVRVYALDVGKGQLHWRLRSDPRVIVREGINARYLKSSDFAERFALITVDVSFISLTKILPALVPLLEPDGQILALVKPQFEVGRGEVGKKGIVRDPVKHHQVLDRIRAFAEETLHLGFKGVIESPITGAEGNKEFFVLLAQDAEAPHHEVSPILHRS